MQVQFSGRERIVKCLFASEEHVVERTVSTHLWLHFCSALLTSHTHRDTTDTTVVVTRTHTRTHGRLTHFEAPRPLQRSYHSCRWTPDKETDGRNTLYSKHGCPRGRFWNEIYEGGKLRIYIYRVEEKTSPVISCNQVGISGLYEYKLIYDYYWYINVTAQSLLNFLTDRKTRNCNSFISAFYFRPDQAIIFLSTELYNYYCQDNRIGRRSANVMEDGLRTSIESFEGKFDTILIYRDKLCNAIYMTHNRMTNTNRNMTL